MSEIEKAERDILDMFRSKIFRMRDLILDFINEDKFKAAKYLLVLLLEEQESQNTSAQRTSTAPLLGKRFAGKKIGSAQDPALFSRVHDTAVIRK